MISWANLGRFLSDWSERRDSNPRPLPPQDRGLAKTRAKWVSIALSVHFLFLFGSGQLWAKPDHIIIHNDPGGYVVDYAQKLSEVRKSGRKVIIAGRCNSACTLFLAYSGTCVRKGASLGFHAPHGGVGRANHWAKVYMLKEYPPKVKAWLRARGGLTNRVRYLYGKDLQKVARRCQ